MLEHVDDAAVLQSIRASLTYDEIASIEEFLQEHGAELLMARFRLVIPDQPALQYMFVKTFFQRLVI